MQEQLPSRLPILGQAPSNKSTFLTFYRRGNQARMKSEIVLRIEVGSSP